MNEEKNNTRALQYFMRAHEKRNPDAAYNLGHMHVYAKLPGGKSDKVMC